MTIEDGTHSGSRNVVEKFTLNTVQYPQNEKSVSNDKVLAKCAVLTI
jgi:hypothetical protein